MATLSVFAEADLAVQIHVAAALTSIAMTPFVLWRAKRDRLHKKLGYVWVSSMTITCLSAFAISSFGMIGPFSPLHLLAVFGLWSLFVAIRWVIRGNIEAHQKALRNLATYALGLPMVFNFLPDRTFTRAFFAEDWRVGFILSAVAMAAIVLWRAQVRGVFPFQRGQSKSGLSA